MFTQVHRPIDFPDLCGQPLVVEALSAVSRRPDRSPRVFIFKGAFGTGKTSAARILARKLNCTCEGDPQKRPECICTDAALGAKFMPQYQEYDAAVMGTKDEVTALREELFIPAYSCNYRVVVLDEFHMASKASQSALLKILEDVPANLFIVFCTTNVDAVIPTIRSRAVELDFRTVGEEELRTHIVKVVNSEGVEIGDELVGLIVRRARGHVRNAVMMLDAYVTLGSEESFFQAFRSCEPEVALFLRAARVGDVEKVGAQIKALCGFPLETVRQDLFQVVTEILRSYTVRGQRTEGKVENDQKPSGTSGTGVSPILQAGEEVSGNKNLPLPVSLGSSIPNTKSKSTSSGSSDTTAPPDHQALRSLQLSLPELLQELGTLYGRDSLRLVAFLSSDWAVNSLADPVRLQALLWGLVSSFKAKKASTGRLSHAKKL